MKKIVVAIVVITVIVLAGAGVWATGLLGHGTPETITIAAAQGDSPALLYVAEDRGFFAENGLNVTLRPYDTAGRAIRGMGDGEADLSLSPEYSVVAEALNGSEIRVIASIDQAQGYYLVARRDRGITTLADLEGKTIALSRGGAAEFYLGRALELQGLSITNVTLLDMPSPTAAEGLITNGSVDAVITALGYVDAIGARLGDNGVVLPAQSNQSAFAVLAGRGDRLAARQQAVEWLLASLAQAETYTADHPTEARVIVKHRLQYDEGYTGRMWPNHRFVLSLDRSLFIAMNDEARWMIANNLTAATTPPSLRDYIDTTALSRVNPGAVRIL